MATIWVGMGGALGAMARYHLDGWLRGRLSGFPWGILIVNALGSFLLSLLMVVSLHSDRVPESVRLALATGVLGGFTTYSTFNYETLRYLQEGSWTLAVLNVGATLGGCLLAGWLGWAGGRLLLGV